MARGGIRTRLSVEKAYDAAVLLSEGHSPAAIAARMYGPQYRSLSRAGKSRELMRVKQLIRRASKDHMLQVTPPLRRDVRQQLERHERLKGIRFHVVADMPTGAAGKSVSDPLYRAAARVIARRIHELLLQRSNTRSIGDTLKRAGIVVANAGGPALSRAVEYLPQFSKRVGGKLCFVSLNAARSPTQYDLSANFIAVRMAAIYAAAHFASLPDQHDDYDSMIEGIDLLICGAGARRAFLDHWITGKPSTRSAALGKSVGDICFIPIDSNGAEVAVKDGNVANRIAQTLRPRPAYRELQRLGSQGKVLAVFAQPDILPAGIDRVEFERDKAMAAVAILKARLATEVVLGASFGTSILRILETSG